MQKQTTATKISDVKRDWYVIDAEGLTLGRIASEVAKILMGKNKVYYTTNLDCGDNVIILNAEKISLSGNKINKKIYYNHSGYAGGLRERTARTMINKYPVELFERTVKGMLPKGPLGRQMYRKLFVYKGENHPHEAQQPKTLEFKD